VVGIEGNNAQVLGKPYSLCQPHPLSTRTGTEYGESNMSEENNQETVVIPDTVVELSPLDVVQKEINQLKEKLEHSEKWLDEKRNEIRRIQNAVWSFFNDEFGGGEEEVRIHRDEANELLGDIGSQLLEQEFEGRVVISYSFTVKAESEDEAREKVESAVSGMEYNFDAGADDSYSEESIEVDI
jgi:ribosomal protein L3